MRSVTGTLLAKILRWTSRLTDWRPSDEQICRLGRSFPLLQCLPTPMRDGRILYLDLRNPVSIPYLLEGKFPCEQCESRLVSRLVRPGDTTIDIGANVGWYSSLLAREVGSEGQVHAVEPNKEAACLVSALGRRFPQLRAHSLALGANNDRRSFHIPDNWISGSLQPASDGTETQETLVLNLDDFLQMLEVGTVDFIKLDAEGGEMDVLQGAERTLRRADAPIWMLELSTEEAARFGHHPAELLGVFERSENPPYRAYVIVRDGQKLKPMKIPDSDEFWFNALLVPENRSDRLPPDWLP
jgi:FkbM family methyltransferase